MILFKKRFVDDILSGRKTVTRRGGKKRWNVGAVHQCRFSYFGEPFANVRIVKVDLEPLWLVREGDEAQKEGFATTDEFFNAYAEINHINAADLDECEMVWRVEFEVNR